MMERVKRVTHLVHHPCLRRSHAHAERDRLEEGPHRHRHRQAVRTSKGEHATHRRHASRKSVDSDAVVAEGEIEMLLLLLRRRRMALLLLLLLRRPLLLLALLRQLHSATTRPHRPRRQRQRGEARDAADRNWDVRPVARGRAAAVAATTDVLRRVRPGRAARAIADGRLGSEILDVCRRMNSRQHLV
jgi:hypothetical protein